MTAYMTPVMMWWEARAPRERLLLAVLLIVLAVWVGLLVAMYVTMVRPRHQRNQIPAGDSSATLYPAAGARPAPVP